MKINLQFFLILLLALFCNISFGASSKNSENKQLLKAEKVDSIINFFKSENMFFGGQPTLETLELVKNEGVDLVINLRTDKEMDAFAQTSFNEKATVKKLGMNYISVPVDGSKSYTPETLEKFAKALEQPNKKIFIHCASCGRVSYFMIAYLVKYKNYSLADAVAFGKQLKFYLPFEMLLGEDIKMSL